MSTQDPKRLLSEKCAKYRGGRHPTDLYVSLNGNEKWTGTLPEPSPFGSDGPFSSIRRARDYLRANPTPGPVTVWIRGGRYFLDRCLEFGPVDSGPITYAAYPGEEVVLDGGRRIEGFRATEMNGRPVWTVDLPEVRSGAWYFTQLFVNSRRRPRPRLPKSGCYYMEHVSDTPLKGFMAGRPADCFISAPGHVKEWENLTDIDVVAFHYWNEERMPIASFDPATRKVQCSRKSVWPLKDDAAPRYARYWVENVKEALSEPGEWYLDRRAGILCYLPLPGENVETAEVYAPGIPQVLVVKGDAQSGQAVTGLTFRGIRFEHTSWHQPGDRAGFEQAAADVPGVVSLEYAHHCAVEECSVWQVGFYGIELGRGCKGCRVQGNTIADMGAGGVKCIGADEDAAPFERTHGNVIQDNEIAEGGNVFHSAVGVLIIHSFGNDVMHNHIHHMEYSGVSCGWIWGYGPNPTHDNLIAKNHIHHIGTGLLNDMGGIYTLGMQPGTILRHNLIHDVRMHNYGGWAIYADEGSSFMVIEKNVCYDADSEGFHLHYGLENIIRNNIFGFSRLGQVSLNTAPPGQTAFTFLRNIVVADGAPIFAARNKESLEQKGFDSDLNLLWDVSGQGAFSANQHRNEKNEVVTSKRFSPEDMRRLGCDRHSSVADPRFRDMARRDFRLQPDSPAFELGFEEIDISDVGPRKRGNPPRSADTTSPGD